MIPHQSNVLELQPSLLAELESVIEAEHTTVNQFVNVAVAEKLAALRAERYFRQRAARGNRENFRRILEKAGTDETIPGDELVPT